MSLIVGEKKRVVRMFKLGLRAPKITRRILDSRPCGGYAETLLEVEEVMRENELTEVEEIMVSRWKECGLDSLLIANLILESRHKPENYRLLEVIK